VKGVNVAHNNPACGKSARASGRVRTRAWAALLVAGTMTLGCAKPAADPGRVDVRPKVQLVKPEKRTIARSVGQPGFIYAYEQTSIYPKVTGYIEKWNVDIGDRIEKDQVLVEISVPELVAELQQKRAQVVQGEAQVRVAEQVVDVTEHNYAAARARTQEARATVAKYQASVERWESEVKRLTAASGDRVINPQILAESQNQLKADTASREAAKAAAVAGEADEEARKADVAKSKVDVDAARAKAAVDRAEEERLAALVAYTHVRAPYDGVVVARNANTGDYVQPGPGDLSASRGSPDQSASRGTPIYVVARTDKVRVYVDVPESEAAYVSPGTRAKIRIPARTDQEIDASVTRTSWSLQVRTRTLRAEVDLPNAKADLLPGMYAYGKVLVERRDVWAVPQVCIVETGEQNVYYLYDNGKAVRTPVQSGIGDGKWVEVARRQVDGKWEPLTGAEEVIQGDLAELVDGQQVEVTKQQGMKGDQQR
jgi:multidrug efflux pump subunit AcrA (membrane-fusion protein)